MSDQNPSDARLWAQLRRDSTPRAAAPPGPEMVAAYLEGRLDEAGAARIEEWLAGDALARAVVPEETDAEDAAPRDAIRRAQAIVTTGKPRRGWFGLGGWLPRPVLFASACAVVIAFAGALQLGASTYGAMQETEGRIAAAIWSAADPDEKPS